MKHRVHIFDRPNAAADGERHETLSGGAFDHINHRSAAMRAGGDVEKDHLIGALLIVAEGEIDGIADFPQPAFFGPAELHAARHFSIMHVKARNHAFGEHRNFSG